MTNVTFTKYFIGFLSSILLTLAAYFIIQSQTIPAAHAVLYVAGLALIQCIVQLLFFLHVGQEVGTGWNTAILVFTVGVLAILVGGSVWIMYHLNYNMTSGQVDSYMTNQSDAM